LAIVTPDLVGRGAIGAGALKAGFRPIERVRRRVDYQRIYDRGIRVHSKYLTLFTLSNELPIGRLGIAATRKIGGAVVRNKAKRLIREVFRRNKLAPGFDVVVIPKRELVDASLTAIEAEFRSTLERSLRRRR
jgi:ribonuclease P protein component